MIDREKMERALSNIIENAVEAMPNGGELTISNRRSNDGVDIVVMDTGTGMTDETVRKLFTPPFTTKAKGIGLGLAISKRIVEAHGGSIKIETALGEGSCVTVRLPIRQEFREGKGNG
jgi:signal transduction histidine kinase